MTQSDPSRASAIVQRVFAPAAWLLNRLRYAPKFFVIGAAFLVPFLYVTYLQFKGTSDQIDFNASERVGVAYVSPAMRLLHTMQRHQLFTAAAIAGDAQARTSADQAAGDASRWQQELEAADARDGEALGTTARLKEALGLWAKARDGKFGAVAEANKAHNDATAALADVIINYAGNKSNLILDPDLDSYWLMDALLAKLPTIGNTVSIAVSFVIAMANMTLVLSNNAPNNTALFPSRREMIPLGIRPSVETTARTANIVPIAPCVNRMSFP